MILVDLIKWMKILIVVLILMYLLEIVHLRIDVKHKISTFVTQRIYWTSGRKSSLFDIKTDKQLTDNRNLKLATSLGEASMDQHFDKSECLTNNSIPKGPVYINLTAPGMQEVEKSLASTVTDGGRYNPANCTSNHRVAIVIPYRHRFEHLQIFLRHIHPFLQRQQLDYGIYVIEMEKNVTFNRAMLMNIGFVEAMNLRNYSCFVFHDVDLLPEDDRIPYSCAEKPSHLSLIVNNFHERLPYGDIIGGVCTIKTEQFRQINGMSNMFFGWGGEDNDLSKRIQLNNLTILRPPVAIGKYTMIKHTEENYKHPDRRCLLSSTQVRMSRDGLSSLKYKVIQRAFYPLYTWVYVQVNETKQLESDSFASDVLRECEDKQKNEMNSTKSLPQKQHYYIRVKTKRTQM